jgi:hypothetical protein
VGSLIGEAFRAEGLAMPRVALTTTDAHLLFRLVESGRFVGHFGDGLLHFYEDRFALKRLPVALAIPPFAVAVIALKNRTISSVPRSWAVRARARKARFIRTSHIGRPGPSQRLPPSSRQLGGKVGGNR